MRIPHYLIKNHNGIYYFRYVIPENQKDLFPNNKREFRRTLKTHCKQEAVKRARVFWVNLMKSKQLDQVEDWETLSQQEDKMIDHGYSISYTLDELSEKATKYRDTEPFNLYAGNLSEHDKKCLEKYTTYRDTINSSNTVEKQGTNKNTHTNTRSAKLIKDLIDEYLSEKKSGLSPKTYSDYKAKFNMFLEITAIVTLDEITDDVIREYKRIIQKIPSRINQRKETKNKSLRDIIELRLPTIENKTLQKHLMCISAFLKWLPQQRYLTEDLSAILSQIKNTVKKRASEHRATFDREDLDRIFSVDEYQIDCFKGKPFRYWIPLLSLYTGARPNELCQLHIDDIVSEHGLYAINIDETSEDQSLKTASSKRLIPIHKTLIELGFLDYVELLKKRKENLLFPMLTADKYGHKIKNVSRFFNSSYRNYNGFLDRCGVNKENKNGKKVLYSFRHTFINQAKQQGIEPFLIKQLSGHTSDDITMNRYGKDYDIKRLKKEIDSIEYGNVLPKKWHKHFY